MNRTVARLGGLIAALISATAAGALAAPPVLAGQYSVYYANGAGCGLFVASPTAGWSAKTCGSPYLAIGTAFGTLSVPGGSEENLSTTAPAGITISDATSSFSVGGQTGSNGWGSGDFYSGGGNSWNSGATSPWTDPGFASSEWGFQLLCGASGGCGTEIVNGGVIQNDPPYLDVSAVTFTANESESPSLAPTGSADLLNQTSGYVWNPAEDPWSIAVAGSDPSGTCNITATVNGSSVGIENQAANPYAWQQCSNGAFPASLDTRQYESGSGALSMNVEGTDAAGNSSSFSRTIEVDNDPVDVSLATPNDANATVWVNHAVDVTAAASAGPSGISATSCSIDGAASFTYPTGGFTVDGDGDHTISCTAQNNAVDPQGAHNSGTASEHIRIDEAPPTLAFAPVNPDDPDELVVNTSDNESGVASGSITVQGPHATSATAVPTTLSGGQLLAHFNDGGKNGNYTFTATSCDAVGNCASTQEVLHFPIRLGSQGWISFHRIYVPAATVEKRIRVGAHNRTITHREKIHGRYRRVKRTVRTAGHVRRVRIRVRRNQRCGERVIHVRVGRHHRLRRRRVRACRKMRERTRIRSRQRLGHRIRVYGLLRTKQGSPLAHARVIISTRPDDRGGRYSREAVTRTNKYGRWEVKLPGGPSRTIRARYPGSDVVEPATAHAQLSVPAGIRLRITPRTLPWSGVMHLSGHLVGRYVPHDGVALRLLVHYPHARGWTVLQALRTNRHGAFRFGWSYNAGRGVASYPFRIASTSTETDYPYAAGSSPPVRVTFGLSTPAQHYARPNHRRRHHHHQHRRRRRRESR